MRRKLRSTLINPPAQIKTRTNTHKSISYRVEKSWLFCEENKDLYPQGLKNVSSVTVIRGTRDLAEAPLPSHTVLPSILPVFSALRLWCKRWSPGGGHGWLYSCAVWFSREGTVGARSG